MPIIEERKSLQPFNTFGIDATARLFTVVRSVDDIKSLIDSNVFHSQQHLIIGGGSNLLLTGDFDGIAIKNELFGITNITEGNGHIVLDVGSGENWHSFVLYCINKGYGGIENLSLIPGTVGAAPMQNIGAYGIEIKDTIESVSFIDINTGEQKILQRDQCQFGYRESIFKHELKGTCFITGIRIKLTTNDHKLNISYGAIRDVLQQEHPQPWTIKAVSDAVISIRQSKLPDPAVIGNAGSFFKNPSVSAETLDHIKLRYPNAPSFPDVNGLFKIPAAWLIEQCGWKGKTLGAIGVHKLQALVLVNYGGGKGNDLWKLAMDIQASVKETFNILLQPEVNVI
jgi:UDP-N-acetylmuramate dehydrogenase